MSLAITIGILSLMALAAFGALASLILFIRSAWKVLGERRALAQKEGTVTKAEQGNFKQFSIEEPQVLTPAELFAARCSEAAGLGKWVRQFEKQHNAPPRKSLSLPNIQQRLDQQQNNEAPRKSLSMSDLQQMNSPQSKADNEGPFKGFFGWPESANTPKPSYDNLQTSIAATGPQNDAEEAVPGQGVRFFKRLGQAAAEYTPQDTLTQAAKNGPQ